MTEELPRTTSVITFKTEPEEARPRTPETNCAICLEEFTNKAVTNNCFHEFCYLCLKEWSKIKPECPLCKTRFQTIIYNIRSQNDYDEYQVESNEIEVVSSWITEAFERPLFAYRIMSPPPGDTFRRDAPQDSNPQNAAPDLPAFSNEDLNNAVNGIFRHRREIYRQDRYLRPPYSRIRESSPDIFRNAVNARRMLPPDESGLYFTVITQPPATPSGPIHRNPINFFNVPSSTPSIESPSFEQDLASTISLNSARHRRDIYRQDRWVRPPTTRIRDSSPEFYRFNPAQTHRLVPWLMRELNVLLDVSFDPQALCRGIIHLITIYPIRSRVFREAMRTPMGGYGDHFVHEFYYFAISPHEMASYDVIAEYDPPGLRPASLIEEIASDSDSDIEVVSISGIDSLPLNPLQVPGGRNGCNHSLLDLTNRAGPSAMPVCINSNEVIIISSSDTDSEIEIIEVPRKAPEIVIIGTSSSEDEDNTEMQNGQASEVKENNNGCVLNNAVSGCSTCTQPAEALMELRKLYHTLSSDSNVAPLNTSSESSIPSCSSTSKSTYLPKRSKSQSPLSYSSNKSGSSSNEQSYSSSTTSASTSTSSVTSSSSFSDDSDDSDYGKKRTKRTKSKKRISNSRRNVQRKRVKRCHYKNDSTSEDEKPKLSRTRLKSVVVKPAMMHPSNHNSRYKLCSDSD